MKTYEMPGELVLDAPMSWTKLHGFKIRLHIGADRTFTVIEGQEHVVFLSDDDCHVCHKRTGAIVGDFKSFEEALEACRKDEVHHAD